jgi:hypothetical protein
MVCHDKYWCHKFKIHKNLWCYKKSWIAMKIWIPYCQMARHLIITWKTKSLLINCRGQQYFQLLINEINSSNQWHESWCEVSVTSHEVLQLLVNFIAMWHATSTSHDHKLLLFTKSCKN